MGKWIVLLFFVVAISFTLTEAAGEPGVITGSSTMVPQSQDENQRSMSDWYTSTDADSVGVVTIIKYGLHYLLKGLKNNSGTLQKIIYIVAATGDTTHCFLNAYEFSGKLPVISKVIEGMVVDSTALFFQYQ
jgi:hypothetical protein